jgi:hypothetical protein
MGKKDPIPDPLTVVYQRALVDQTEALLMAPYPHWYTHVNQLPLPERLTYCVLIFDAQVGNGGLPQYFGNSYGQFAYETVAYLDLLGATAQAGILRQALTLLEGEQPVPALLREKIHTHTLEGLNSEDQPFGSGLDKLTDAYFACPADLEERLQQFLATYEQAQLGVEPS